MRSVFLRFKTGVDGETDPETKAGPSGDDGKMD